MSIRLEYRAKVVPYVRMTQRGKYVNPRAKTYLASKDALAWEMKKLDAAMLPERTPFDVDIYYLAPAIYRFDLDNLVKAVLDAGNGILYPDDRWCRWIAARKDTYNGCKDYYLKLRINFETH